MSAISARLGVTSSDDPIYAFMNGTFRNIPTIELGDQGSASFEIALNSKMLSPAEQASWLRKLAAAAEELAEQVESLVVTS